MRKLLVPLACLSLLAQASQAAAPPRDDDVVALVNGVPIYRRSVRAIVQGTLVAQEQESEPSPEVVRRLAKDALDSLIDFELLFQESQARQVGVDEADIDSEMNRTQEKFGGSKAFSEALRSQGLTENDLRQDTRKSLAVNRLLEGDILRDVRIGDAQVEEYYTANKEQFHHPPQTRASHILLRVPPKAGKKEVGAIEAKAKQLWQLLRDGADFAEVARTHSQDPGTAARGGDLGYFADGEMDPAFEKAAASLKTGQISGVVRSTYGWHIIGVTDRRDAGYDSIDEARERIRSALQKSERRKRQADLAIELRKNAKITYPAAL